jgi:hypothetical protein
MRKLIFALTMMSTTPLTASPFRLEYDCHTPDIYDRGYAVHIEPGRFFATARVFVGEDSYRGTRSLARYHVSVSPYGPYTLFEGDGFAMTMNEWRGRWDDGGSVYARFRVITDSGAVVRGRLVCGSQF